MSTKLKTRWIENLAITNAKLDTTSVSTGKIQDLAITADKLDATSVTGAKLGAIAGNGLTGGSGSNLSVLADSTSLTVGASGIKVSNAGILAVHLDTSAVTYDKLAGSIPDSKLSQLTTTDKVAATAVQDRFLRNDGDDTGSGRISAYGLDAQTQTVTRVADGILTTDAVNLGQLQTVATQSKSWKEAVLAPLQLSDGASGGIFSGQVITLASNLSDGTVISFHDGSIQEDFTSVTVITDPLLQFAIGGTITETLTNLSNLIDASSSIAISSIVSDLQSIDPVNNVLIVAQDTIGEPTRVFGNAAFKFLPTSMLYNGYASDLTSIPGTDPAAINFGFSRAVSALVINETHLTRSQDSAYTWDSDSTKWVLSGEASIPYASKIQYGKVQINNGIEVASGVISVERDVIGGAQLASAINVTSNGVAVRVDSTTIEGGVNGVLQVKNAGIDENKLAASVAGDGLSGGAGSALSVNVDSTGIEIASDILRLKDAGVTESKLAASVAGDGLSGGAGTALSVNVDSTSIEINSDTLRVKDSGITAAKLAASVAGNGLNGGDGTALSVNVDSTTIEINSDILRVKDKAITAAKLGVDVAGGGLDGGDGTAISIAAGGVGSIHLNSEVAGNGLSGGDGTALSVNVDSTSIEINSDTLRIKASGVSYSHLNLDATSGLQDSGSGKIQIKVKAAGGVILDSSGLSVDQSQINAINMIEHTVTSDNISSKSLTLTTPTANTNAVQLTILGGLMQNFGADYTCTNSTTISWNGLGLEADLLEGDELAIAYPA